MSMSFPPTMGMPSPVAMRRDGQQTGINGQGGHPKGYQSAPPSRSSQRAPSVQPVKPVPVQAAHLAQIAQPAKSAQPAQPQQPAQVAQSVQRAQPVHRVQPAVQSQPPSSRADETKAKAKEAIEIASALCEEFLEGMSTKWEQRFLGLEETVSATLLRWEARCNELDSNLRKSMMIATGAAKQCGEFLQQAKAHGDQANLQESQLWSKLQEVEQEVHVLAHWIGHESGERARNQEIIRQAESQINNFLQSINSQKFQEPSTSSQQTTPPMQMPTHVPYVSPPAGGIVHGSPPRDTVPDNRNFDDLLAQLREMQPGGARTNNAQESSSLSYSQLDLSVPTGPIFHEMSPCGVQTTSSHSSGCFGGLQIDQSVPAGPVAEDDAQGNVVDAVRAALARIRDESQQSGPNVVDAVREGLAQLREERQQSAPQLQIVRSRSSDAPGLEQSRLNAFGMEAVAHEIDRAPAQASIFSESMPPERLEAQQPIIANQAQDQTHDSRPPVAVDCGPPRASPLGGADFAELLKRIRELPVQGLAAPSTSAPSAPSTLPASNIDVTAPICVAPEDETIGGTNALQAVRAALARFRDENPSQFQTNDGSAP